MLGCLAADLPVTDVVMADTNVDKLLPVLCSLLSSARKSSIRRFVIAEKAPTRAFSWLKAATTAFTFKTL